MKKRKPQSSANWELKVYCSEESLDQINFHVEHLNKYHQNMKRY